RRRAAQRGEPRPPVDRGGPRRAPARGAGALDGQESHHPGGGGAAGQRDPAQRQLPADEGRRALAHVRAAGGVQPDRRRLPDEAVVMTPDTPREQVVIGSRVLAANGHADMVWGHLSVRDPDGRGVWIKRAGRGFDELVPEDVHLLSWDGELLEGQGPVHLEYHIHTEVMRARDDVGAVVHSHPEAAVTLAATGLPLQPLGHEGTYFTPPDVPRYREKIGRAHV